VKIAQVIIFTLGCALSVQFIFALDAAPPPEIKTLQWTFETAQGCKIPVIQMKDTKIREVIDSLDDSSASLAGFYLDIDTTNVRDRLDWSISVEAKDISWMAFLGLVADRLDAKIIVEPGVFRLVPLESKNLPPKK
jgi:hypothetical protein